MKIDKSEIASKLANLRKVIPSKTDIECMRGVLVKNRTMTATNLLTTLQTSIECGPQECFILPLRAIDMIESLPDGMIEIQAESDNALLIRSGTTKSRIATYPVENFPEVDSLEDAEQVGIESDRLQDAINTILYAVATTSRCPAATGLLFEGDGMNLNLVAMDGYRMAWAQIPYSRELRMIVPRASVQMLLTLGLTGMVNIRYNQRAAVFEVADFVFYSRLLDGEYPKYREAFPGYTDSVLIDRKAMMESLRRAAICLEDKTRPMVVLDIGGEELTLSTKSGVGDYTETLRLEAPAEKGVKIGFNGRYLQECFKSYSSPVVECFFGSSHQPMVVDDGEIKSLVLPVRMRE